MPKSLISSAQKNTIKSIIDDIHSTFAREIKVFEDGEKVLISSSSEFNSIYSRNSSGAETVQRIVVSHTVQARIKYINSKEKRLTDGDIDSQLDIQLINGSVRITVDEDGFRLLKKAKRCEFEGRKYTINSKGNPTGIFGPQYYHFYLSPIEE